MRICLWAVALTLGLSLCSLWSLNCWSEGRLLAAPAQISPGRKANLIRDIPYVRPADPKGARRQTLDLYLPAGLKTRPPLVIFVHGGFWTLSDDEHRIGPAFADALVPNGIAVALVRYRLAPAYTHPAQAQDVAAAVAYLIREADKYGYDSRRIFIAGHSAGAYLAALVALDPAYLAAHRMEPRSLGGVIAFSGIYSLRPTAEFQDQTIAIQQAFGGKPDTLKAASPITHVRADAPPFLILSAASDFSGFAVDAKKFGDALRKVGHRAVEQFILPELDHFSIVQLIDKTSQARSLLLEFLNVQPLPAELALLIEAKRRWRNPPFSTLPFWEHKELIRPYPIDGRLVQRLLPIYEYYRYELLEWPLERFYAIDLFSYLDSLPPKKAGRGNYLTITNIRDEKEFWDRRQTEPYKPVIVIGIDDEKNLFRLGTFYRGLREYSWKSGPQPPLMARPVGAFIHFLKEPPLEFLGRPSLDALATDSFRLTETDPLAPLGDVPREVYQVLTRQNGCLYCHNFRGIGSRSHHKSASDGASHGGFALPLEEYPPAVWKAFIFDNQAVAAKIGASPNAVDEEARQALYDLVVELRNKQKTSNK